MRDKPVKPMCFRVQLLSLTFFTLIPLVWSSDLESANARNKADNILRVVWMEFEPFCFQRNNQLVGFSIDLLKAIADDQGLTLAYFEEPATFRETLNMVSRGEADITANPFFQLASREAVLDFSHTAIDSGSQIVVSVNDGASLNILAIIRSSGVLEVIGIGLVVLLLVAHIVWLVERRQKDRDFNPSYFQGVWDGLWWAAVTVTTVGYGDEVPKGVIGRVVALFWMFAGLFLVSLFIAQFTTALTVSRLENTIQGPSDLQHSLVGTTAGSAFETDLANRGIQLKLYKRPIDLERGLETGEVEAIVREVNAARYYVLTNGRGKTELAGPPFRPAEMAFAMPTGSPYREAINLGLLTIKENGRYAEIYARWFGESH